MYTTTKKKKEEEEEEEDKEAREEEEGISFSLTFDFRQKNEKEERWVDDKNDENFQKSFVSFFASSLFVY